MNAQTYQAISMVIYFVAMIVIGLWAYQRTDDMDDYMLAGRNLGPLSTALSAGASDMSGWLLMGLPGAFYLSGMSTMWLPIGLTVGAWLNWRYTAPRLRTYTEVADNSLTIPTFLSARLHDGSRLIQIGAGVIILVFFTFYVSSGMVAGGRFFEASFGVDYRLGMVLVAGITVLYTLVGGFLAVAYTDVVQGLMMVTALVAVPVAGLFRLGGPDSLISTINELDPGTWALWGASTSLMSIVSAAAWGLGYFGQPHIIVRFMALETPQQAKAGRRIGIGWMALACLGAAATALIGIATYRRDTGQLPDRETVFIALGQLLFHPFVAGFMLAAILAAIMSTISSQLLVSSSALVEDLYHAFNRKELGEKRSVLLGRVAVMIVSVVAALMAWQADDSILKLVSFAWAGFGASFGPVVLLALFWRRLTRWGALAGMTTGAVVAAVWANLPGGIFDLYELLPGFVANLIVTIVVSLSTEVAPGVDAEFDEAVALVADFRKGELTTSVEN